MDIKITYTLDSRDPEPYEARAQWRGIYFMGTGDTQEEAKNNLLRSLREHRFPGDIPPHAPLNPVEELISEADVFVKGGP